MFYGGGRDGGLYVSREATTTSCASEDLVALDEVITENYKN